jgi:hypothetical protein
MKHAVKAGLLSSSVFIALLVGWQLMIIPPGHRTVVGTLAYCLWVVPLFGITVLVNRISLLGGRRLSRSPAVIGVLAFVLIVGLTLIVSESTRSLGGAMTRLQFGVTVAFALPTPPL